MIFPILTAFWSVVIITPPSSYTPALKFNDKRNSMYLPTRCV